MRQYVFNYQLSERTRQIAVCCTAFVDLMIYVPIAGYIIVKYFSDESWTEQHEQFCDAINVHIGLSFFLGCCIVPIMRLKVGVQIAVIILMRLFCLGLLLALSAYTHNATKFAIWIISAWILLVVVPHCAGFAVKSENIQASLWKNIAKTWLPSAVITIICCVVVHYFADTDGNFVLGYYALYVCGFEIMLASLHFCILLPMTAGEKDSSFYSVISEGKKIQTELRHKDAMYPVDFV